MSSYYVVNPNGHYYTGEMFQGTPVTTTEKNRAMEMTDKDIKQDFPKGLPEGWKQVIAD